MTRPNRKSALWGAVQLIAAVGLMAMAGCRVEADEVAVPHTGSAAFASHCFSPFMTAERAQEVLASPGVRVDFYDLDPFSSADPSPVTGRAATPGTDRRCEVAFDGDHARLAASAAVAGLEMEGIDQTSPVPDRYERTDGTELLAARRLNPRRVAVVHVGTRPGPNGIETFMLVERMTPLEPVE
ncbi:succinyl-CoA synthetase subunit beta [Gymnodinialimonas sp.]